VSAEVAREGADVGELIEWSGWCITAAVYAILLYLAVKYGADDSCGRG
jgi:hypothetical protein